MYVSVAKASKHFGVCSTTIRNWADSGKLRSIRTPTNQRQIYIGNDSDSSQRIIYCRVSSVKQKKDLQHQIEFMQQKFPKYKLVTDIGSGLNFKRKGFLQLLDSVFDGTITEIVVATQDRFCRFGFDLFKYIFTKFGTKLYAFDSTTTKAPSEELSQDLLSIITIFTAKYHGSRKYKLKNNEDQNLSES